jgi:galactonate dehydratase
MAAPGLVHRRAAAASISTGRRPVKLISLDSSRAWPPSYGDMFGEDRNPMKIEKIVPILVDRCLLVRVYTDEGIVGTGEAGLWAQHRLVHDAITQLADYYVGEDATTIEHHFQTVSRDTHFSGSVLSAALSAIDIALWDILGKAVNRPVYQLLGGKCRDRVRTFANVSGNSLQARAE